MNNMRGVFPFTVGFALVLSGCSGPPSETTPSPKNSTSNSSPTPTQSTPTSSLTGVVPVGTPTVLATKLQAPWSVVRLESGAALISERDAGTIVEYSNGSIRTVGKVDGVVHDQEGGLLGLAVLNSGATYLYAYYTSASDNRIVRMPLLGSPGSYSLGPQTVILKGLEKASNHNGGRLAFGPDGKLYATVGDATEPDRAQSLASLNGKILRMNPDGSVPVDNPFPGSLVYSYGHRNPQGLAWDSNGQLWASEFGQDTWDEFNRIEPGKNYGWPTVEGIGNQAGFVDPVLEWSTDQASPSGLCFVDGTFFMVGLRGQRLWVIQTNPADPTDWFSGEYGRLRDVIPGPNNTIWVLTNNTDGRGDPTPQDDRLLEIRLASPQEG